MIKINKYYLTTFNLLNATYLEINYNDSRYLNFFPVPQRCGLSESKTRTIYQPPSILLQITEGSIDNACKKLPPCDEEGIDGDQSTSQVGWRNLSDVHGHCHGCKACREEPKRT